MAECQRCKGAAHNAFLCPQCIEELHQELSNLGWWLDRLTETALGVLVGVAAGVASAVVVSSWALARRVLQPLLVVSQTVPVQVLAPLLVLWTGFGLAPKIIVVALVSAVGSLADLGAGRLGTGHDRKGRYLRGCRGLVGGSRGVRRIGRLRLRWNVVHGS